MNLFNALALCSVMIGCCFDITAGTGASGCGSVPKISNTSKYTNTKDSICEQRRVEGNSNVGSEADVILISSHKQCDDKDLKHECVATKLSKTSDKPQNKRVEYVGNIPDNDSISEGQMLDICNKNAYFMFKYYGFIMQKLEKMQANRDRSVAALGHTLEKNFVDRINNSKSNFMVMRDYDVQSMISKMNEISSIAQDLMQILLEKGAGHNIASREVLEQYFLPKSGRLFDQKLQHRYESIVEDWEYKEARRREGAEGSYAPNFGKDDFWHHVKKMLVHTKNLGGLYQIESIIDTYEYEVCKEDCVASLQNLQESILALLDIAFIRALESMSDCLEDLYRLMNASINPTPDNERDRVPHYHKDCLSHVVRACQKEGIDYHRFSANVALCAKILRECQKSADDAQANDYTCILDQYFPNRYDMMKTMISLIRTQFLCMTEEIIQSNYYEGLHKKNNYFVSHPIDDMNAYVVCFYYLSKIAYNVLYEYNRLSKPMEYYISGFAVCDVNRLQCHEDRWHGLGEQYKEFASYDGFGMFDKYFEMFDDCGNSDHDSE